MRAGPCFVCSIIRGEPSQPEAIIYRDESVISFLARPAAQLGHVLVAPTTHLEEVVSDFDLDTYLILQRTIHRIGLALTRSLPTERRSEQQFNALMLDRVGYIDTSDQEQTSLALTIRHAMDALPPRSS